MGQTLSSPATDKHSTSGGNKRFLYAVSEMQGWRITMEDAHATVLDLDGSPDDSNTFFAVYDGHGGGTVAKFAGQNVHKRLVSEEAYREQQYEQAMKRAFLGTDEDLLADPACARDPSGCTAVAALITQDGKVYVANAGDSRSVLSVQGKVKPLSFDHKPSNETEKTRITNAGGYIEYGRVNGNLALSRALGDFEFKKNYAMIPEQQVITADPDVTVHQLTDEDEFLVIACDGIWDCLTSQQVVDFVRRQVAQGKELTEIGEMMCEHCLAPDTSSGAGIGCDNMTVMIVALLNGRTKEEWYSWIADRVKQQYGYPTPAEPPQIYLQSRLMAFRARREVQQRQRESRDDDNGGGGLLGGSSGFGGFARVLGSTGGISFQPGSGIMSDTGALMFGNDDSDDDSGEEDLDVDDDDGRGSSTARSFFSETLGLGRPESPDPTKSLKAKLDEFEKDINNDEDEESQMEAIEEVDLQTAPVLDDLKPPPPTLNGASAPVEQLKSQPAGDAPSPAVQAEGLLDKSEDPTKA
ncbi:hypothetical protein PLICRDRAFT_39460 [Plicaturopsis crispa FD-325 SS-3]|nr:hypothetical protein PLICRDRAFT_39460 [Plicaturopsis crispa FD-325 SS-3]